MARRLSKAGTETVIATVAEYYGVSPATFQERRRSDESRDVAAWLTRRLTTATLRELVGLFGLPQQSAASRSASGRGIQPSAPCDRSHRTASNKNEKRGLTPASPLQHFRVFCACLSQETPPRRGFKRFLPSKIRTAARPVPQNPSGHPHAP